MAHPFRVRCAEPEKRKALPLARKGSGYRRMPRAIGRASTLPAGPPAVGPAHSREINERRRGHGMLFRKAPADTSLPAHRQVKHLTQRASWAKVFEARP